MNMLSDRLKKVKPSATLTISAKAQELVSLGRDVINLSVGEPDFDTPEHIKQAAIDALKLGQTKYTAVPGIVKLRQAICEKFKHDNQLNYTISQVVVTCGAKQALFNAMQALLNPGDEVIIPAPYWVSYSDMVEIAEAKPVIIKTSLKHGFKMTPEQLEQAITPKTRLLLLNSPSNPTGVAYNSAELKAFAEILARYPQVLILSDDIYEKIYWGKEPFANILNVAPELFDRTLNINGVSKTYSMTGWRIGYAAGPEWMIKGMADLQSHSTSNACSISQAAAAVAIGGDQSCLAPMVKAFKERHDVALKFLNEINGFECLPADGAFYLFPCIKTAMLNLNLASDFEFANFLLEKADVAVVPGSAFGLEGYIRLSTALSLEKLKLALERIKAVIK